MRKCTFAGIEIDALTRVEAIERIRTLVSTGERGYVVTPNADHIVKLQTDSEFRAAYAGAKLVLADSTWLCIASRWAGSGLPERCAGSDLFPDVLQVARECGRSIFLLGGTNGSEKVAEHRIRSEYALEVTTYSPPFGFEESEAETDRIIERINRSGADLLFIHVGAPKSEKWLNRNFDRIDATVACSFGMALDYYAGTRQRAPLAFQRLGLEWFYRLCQEPRRLWRRYLIGNTAFCALAAREIVRRRLGSAKSAARPGRV